jgi:hypothetical protein
VIELATVSIERNFKIAETFAMSQLSKNQSQKLFPTRQPPNASISVVLADTSSKRVVVGVRKNLTKDRRPLFMLRLLVKESGRKNWT